MHGKKQFIASLFFYSLKFICTRLIFASPWAFPFIDIKELKLIYFVIHAIQSEVGLRVPIRVRLFFFISQVQQSTVCKYSLSRHQGFNFFLLNFAIRTHFLITSSAYANNLRNMFTTCFSMQRAKNIIFETYV